MDPVGTTTVAAAMAGSEEALDRLFESCAPRLLAFIRARMGPSLRTRLESRDILQATLLKAFERLDQLQTARPVSLMAWLTRIAEHELLDHADFHRRQRRDAAREVAMEDAPDAALAERARGLSSRLVLDRQLESIADALDRLQPDHREVILLRYFAELGFRELGERMGRSPDAARMLLARAMAALTAMLGETP